MTYFSMPGATPLHREPPVRHRRVRSTCGPAVQSKARRSNPQGNLVGWAHRSTASRWASSPLCAGGASPARPQRLPTPAPQRRPLDGPGARAVLLVAAVAVGQVGSARGGNVSPDQRPLRGRRIERPLRELTADRIGDEDEQEDGEQADQTAARLRDDHDRAGGGEQVGTCARTHSTRARPTWVSSARPGKPRGPPRAPHRRRRPPGSPGPSARASAATGPTRTRTGRAAPRRTRAPRHRGTTESRSAEQGGGGAPLQHSRRGRRRAGAFLLRGQLERRPRKSNSPRGKAPEDCACRRAQNGGERGAAGHHGSS